MKLILYTLGVAVPSSHHWPKGDEGKQAKKHRGVRSAPLPSSEGHAVEANATPPEFMEIDGIPGERLGGMYTPSQVC